MPVGPFADEPISGRVELIARYPVKSMRGEVIECAELTPDGLAQDRLYAFETEAAPPGMLRVSGRERRELLRFSATLTPGGVVVRTPDRLTFPVNDPELPSHFPDFSPTALSFRETPQTDCRPLSIISLQTIQQLEAELGLHLDARRFRANLYLDLTHPFQEDTLVGRTVLVGPHCSVRILERDPRCRFITLDPESTDPLPELMALLHRRHEGRAGVYASVEIPGHIRRGDLVRVQDL